jgi:hypothetical protein
VLGVSVQELRHPVRESLPSPLRCPNPPGLVGAAGSDMQKGLGPFFRVLRGVFVVLGGSHGGVYRLFGLFDQGKGNSLGMAINPSQSGFATSESEVPDWAAEFDVHNNTSLRIQFCSFYPGAAGSGLW